MRRADVATQLDAIRTLAGQRMWRRWTLASFLARLPSAMTLIALVLVGERAGGSLAVGAQLAGAATLASGLGGPWRGRRLDRFELRTGLQRACLLTAAVLVTQAWALVSGAPLALLFALAAAQGLAMGAITGGFRALLTPVVAPRDLPRAHTLEAVFVELAFVAGPALAGLLALAVGPAGVLLTMAGAATGAALVAQGLPRLPPSASVGSPAPWRTPGVWPVYGLTLAVGFAFGLFESALPARATDLGLHAASAGPLLALMAAGSGIGGLVAAVRGGLVGGANADRVRRHAVWLLSALGLLLIPTALLPWVPVLALALLVSGLPIAPLNALGAMRLQGAVPHGRRAEGFAVYIAALVLGVGIGQVSTGLLLDHWGAQWLMLASAAVPWLAALMLGAAGARRSGAFRAADS